MSLPFRHSSPINSSLKIYIIRTIAPEENCPPTPKLTLTKTLNLTGGGEQFSSWAIVWLPSNPKSNPNLNPNPNPNLGAIFIQRQLSGYHFYSPWLFGFAVWEKLFVFLLGFSFTRTIQMSLKMLIKRGP